MSTEPAGPSVEILTTPNPDALMFCLEEHLVPRGSFEFSSPEQAGSSPLARALFAVDGVAGVLVAPTFVTITRAPGAPWPALTGAVQGVLVAFVEGGEVAVDAAAVAAVGGEGEVERRIQDLIAESIQPSLEADGGAIEYVGFIDGQVHVRLQGACGTCPHATATLAYGVQRFLMQHVPEVKGVVRVD